ncbi:hypothetical protein OQH60_08595, partial [Campylobacter sp. MIT 21-1685]|nr:hypothetical protein [Campylobacter sp. MIT 21-1684]MCX2752196.1 hypothetical protein [Campylobacter sp. MIT 21-1682]MCX2808391.1 hypothetical protein [Campylobacter sp. MIT 21-1685]
DSFGMLPYLDELIGVDWVMDFNEHDEQGDSRGEIIHYLRDKVRQGKLKDPRDKDSTPESRREFLEDAYGTLNNNLINYNCDLSNNMSEEGARLYIYTMLLEAKVRSITPPQGYPNAPYYYTPEQLELIYKNHKLDKKQNPTIPAIYRENFPEYLRKEIEEYAR